MELLEITWAFLSRREQDDILRRRIFSLRGSEALQAYFYLIRAISGPCEEDLDSIETLQKLRLIGAKGEVSEQVAWVTMEFRTMYIERVRCAAQRTSLFERLMIYAAHPNSSAHFDRFDTRIVIELHDMGILDDDYRMPAIIIDAVNIIKEERRQAGIL